ncbi:MAG: MBL fold metallo-hydrolase [Proteobacteria bacterium]|jgi:glyoxylase-like metal-dependent hydrolase (beta-lactamase superfamily II)|nr:MBL fold metallo-hydrolase [Pseudomonadota bacterium]
MILEKLELGPFMTNCYICGDEKTREAAVIDPGFSADEILRTLTRHKLKLLYIIITHAHIDHIGAAKSLKESTDAKILIHKEESKYLITSPAQAVMFGMKPSLPPSADQYIKEGDEIKIGSIVLKVYLTAGHSPGGISLYAANEKVIFVGDSLFSGSIGRTDLIGGDYDQLIRMIREKIFTLPEDTRVCPGHGPDTSVGFEKKHNPFF